MLAPNQTYVNRRIACQALRTTTKLQCKGSITSGNNEHLDSRFGCALDIIREALHLNIWPEAATALGIEDKEIYYRNDGLYPHKHHTYKEIADYIESLP